MIQRIQSVYLLIASLVLVLFALFGVPPRAGFAAQGWLFWALVGASALAALAAVYAILLYADRERQRRAVAGVQWLVVLVVLLLALTFLLHPALHITLRDVGDMIGYLLPVVAYVLVRLAQRSIDRDIALVKSMDRLR